MGGKVPIGWKRRGNNVIPEDWDIQPLKNIAEFENGLAHEKSITSDGKYIVVNSKFVSTDGETKKYTDTQLKPVFCTDILMVMSDVPKGRALAKCFFVDRDNRYSLNQRICVIRTSHLDSNYLCKVLNRNSYFLEFDSGVGQTNLKKSEVLACPIPLPPLPEQQKIAEILTSVDETIESTRKVIAQTKKVKQGLLQELLTKGIGHTKFKDTEIGRIPAEWEVVRLGEIIESIDSGWSPQCELNPADAGVWGVLKTTAVVWGGYNDAENKRLPVSLAPREALEVKTHDVLITRAGPIERVGVVVHVRTTREKLMLSDKIIRLRLQVERCEPEFIAIYLSGEIAQTYLLQRKTGLATAQTNISQKVLREALVALPPDEEQKQIASILTSIDNKITAQEKELAALQQMKKGLMQDLLTGKVRVKV